MPSILDGTDGFSTSFMGKIVNVVSTHLTTGQSQIISSQTKTQIANLSASITPQSVNSKILILAQWSGEISGPGPHDTMFGLQRGTTDLGMPNSPSNRNAGIMPCAINYMSDVNSTLESCNFIYLDSPATTSSTTYTMTFEGYSAATLYTCRTVNDGDYNYVERTASTITLIEIL